MSPTGWSVHPPSTHQKPGTVPIPPLTKYTVGLSHLNFVPLVKALVKHKLYPHHWQINESDYPGMRTRTRTHTHTHTQLPRNK